VIGWFYLDWFPNTIGNNFSPMLIMMPVTNFLDYGIWLVPIFPIVIVESKKSGHIRYRINAGTLVWVCASEVLSLLHPAPFNREIAAP
jgi:hypothetical protein